MSVDIPTTSIVRNLRREGLGRQAAAAVAEWSNGNRSLITAFRRKKKKENAAAADGIAHTVALVHEIGCTKKYAH